MVLSLGAWTLGRRSAHPAAGPQPTEGDRFFALSRDLLAVTSPDGRFRRLNPAWEAALGWTEEELSARPWLDLVHPDDRPATVAAAGRPLADGAGIRRIENRYRCKDGSYRRLSWSLPPAAPGEPVLHAARDVTESRAAEEEIHRLDHLLAQRASQVTQAHRELESFSYAISHDLRAPLRAIHAFAGFLDEDYAGKLDAEGRRLIAVIRAGAERMGRQIEDLLAFTRLARHELSSTRVDMAVLARAAARDLETAAAGRCLDFRIGDVPAAQGDAALLRQVLVNLLDNAVKFTRPRAQAVIELEGASPGAESTYVVRDNGVGFDMALAGKLFGVFQRLHRDDEFEGTGVGLALAARIIHRHGGRIWAEAAVDRGASFHFTIPGPGEDHD